MREKNCKIVRDLLPNYVENLTEKETNQYIEEHLKECKECQEIQESMKGEIKFSQNEDEKKKIDGLKKYHTKLKLLKSIVIVILLIFIFHVARNMLILSSMQNKRKEYQSVDNYWVKANNFCFKYDSDEVLLYQIATYQKGNRALLDSYKVNFGTSEKEKITKCKQYYNGKQLNTYMDSAVLGSGNIKKAQLNRESSYEGYFSIDTMYFENPIDFWLASVCASINKEVCNGKQCYRISNLPEFTVNDEYSSLADVIYVEKETGLTLRIPRMMIRKHRKSKSKLSIMNMVLVLFQMRYLLSQM